MKSPAASRRAISNGLISPQAAPRLTCPPPIVSRLALPPVKEISLLELLLRAAGRIAAVSGVIGLLVWLTWVMLDFKSMQSGFTLPY